MASKPHKALRILMGVNDIDTPYLSKRWGKSRPYISARLMGKHPFTILEVYDLCSLLEIDTANIPQYFPPKGIEDKQGKGIVCLMPAPIQEAHK